MGKEQQTDNVSARFEMTMDKDLRAAMRMLAKRSAVSEAAWLRRLIAAEATKELGLSWIKGEAEVS